MSRTEIEVLLDRYLDGEASPEEIKRVEAWLDNKGNTNPEWQQMDKTSRDKWLSGLYNQVENTIDASKVVVMKPRNNTWRYIAAAAAILAIFFTIYLERPVLQNLVNPVQLTALNVPEGQKKHIVLADGSEVWVNAGSQLKYPVAFNGKTREIYLSGEAYFDVYHDAAKPFIIHTGKVITTVLGTAFNIKEDKNLHTVEVTVTRGKVGVAAGSKALGIITPNQQISFNTVSEEHVQKNIDAEQIIAWQQADLRFEDITFADAALQLQQRFNVKIHFANEKIKQCRFTGTALKGANLDKILKIICAFNKTTYKSNPDGSITIDGTGCN